MTPLQILTAARNKIAKPEHWTQGESCRNSSGQPCAAQVATCFCSIGAIGTVAGEDWEAEQAAMDMLRRAIDPSRPLLGLATFNDTHTHAEVLAAFDKAIHENS